MHELVRDITLCILFAWALAIAAHLVRQPSMLGYLLAGFLIGPFGTGLVKSEETVAIISELGLVFMLFMIGLEIDLKKVIRAGSVILLAGGAQILGGCILGAIFFFAITPVALRYDALYLTVACALSSTVIIVKLLYDKREIDTLPGRLTIGILVIQDVFAILFLAIQPSLGDLQFGVLVGSLLRAAVLVVTALLVSRYLLPPLFHRVARNPELILLGGLGWCFLVGELAEMLRLSRGMGSLVAGVSLSTFPYALDVTAKIVSLRDFFITLFFVALGMTIPVPSLSVLTLALLIAIFTVASRMIMTFTPLYVMKQGLRASLLPAVNLSQISEFSLVIVKTGVAAGHLTVQTAGAISFAFVSLATLSTFVIARSDSMVRRVVKPLKRIGFHDLDKDAAAGTMDEAEDGGSRPIVILGFFRAASALLVEIERRHPSLLDQIGVVDFNPTVFNTLSERGTHVRYGDISHVETLVHAEVGKAEVIILSVPDSLLKGTTNERLVRQLRGINSDAKIVVTAELLTDVGALYSAGADYVLVPRLNEARELLDAIEAIQADALADKRAEIDRLLVDRREVLP